MLKLRATVRLAFAMPIAISITVFFQVPVIQAQSAMVAVPKWEAASIKPCKIESGGEHGPAQEDDSPNRIWLSCYPLHQLIRSAYVSFAGGHWTPNHPARSPFEPGDVKIEGLPGWSQSENFTIEAKAEGSPGQLMMRGPMLQTLLENRFALKIHSENHDEPAYALTAAKSGLKVRPFLGGCTPENFFAWRPTAALGKDTCPRTFQHWPMNLDTFVFWLGVLPRTFDAPVINQTGIKGYYRFNFMAFQALNPPPFAVPPDQVMDSVRAALADIGLKLVTTKAPRRHLIIDHVEKPSAN